MAATIGLREDFDATALRALAKRTKKGPQARRLLALPAIYDGATRSEAAKIGVVTLQIVRDWVVRFNALGPEGLVDRKAPGQRSRLDDERRAALARIAASKTADHEETIMANIGIFKKSGSEFHGEIITLSVQVKGIRIAPEANRGTDNAPSHRIYVGRAEIGAAWSKRSNEGRDYLSVKLDDPSFTAPIYASLFDDEDGEGCSLIWSRGRKANGD